jgi:DNA-binding transcriptional ArsR family regulator
VWLVVGLTLGVGFGLRAAGTGLPVTIATVIGGAALVIGGPLLMLRLRGITLGKRAGPVSPAKFDELIHAPTRLAIVSLLAAAEWADFRFIRDEVGLSDSALSKQLTTLETAGHVEIRKGFVGKRPRTSARLSKAGRAAFERTSRRCSRSSNDPAPPRSARWPRRKPTRAEARCRSAARLMPKFAAWRRLITPRCLRGGQPSSSRES